MVLEQDPAVFKRVDEQGRPRLPLADSEEAAEEFVSRLQERLESSGAECLSCRWKDFCGGYFKLPDPHYDCEGIVAMFDRLKAASAEMEVDLADFESSNPGRGTPVS